MEGKRPDSVVCRNCKKPVLAKGGNTSNLLSHLKLHHPLLQQYPSLRLVNEVIFK